MRVLLLFPFLLFLPWKVEAKTISVNNGVIYLYLDTDTKKASLTSHPQKYSGDVVIPESITYENVVYTVVQIGWRAFQNCTGLTSVSIPNSVTVIYEDAFKGCSGLKSIEIPNSVTTIGNSAFNGCTGLTSVTIPASVTNFGDNIFGGCTGLASATILSNAAPGPNIFYGCTNLKEATFDCENVYAFFSNNNAIENVTFGDNVKTIKEKAFYGRKSLKSINLSNSISTIEGFAFQNCEGLTSITLPERIDKIGKDGFRGCYNLAEVCISDLKAWCNIVFENEYASPIVYAKKLVLNGKEITDLIIPDGVSSINIAAFANGENFRSVTIPESVTSIGKYAFDGCSAITDVVIPEGVTSIGYSAFGNCNALERVSFPSSVTAIDGRAFENCKSLKAVYVADIGAWCGIEFGDEYANPSYYTSSLRFNDKEITNLVIPEGVGVIKRYAFERCKGIVSVKLPSSLTEIEYYAFLYCDNLSEIYCFADKAPSVKEKAFYGVSDYGLPIYVQESSKGNYENAYWWKNLDIKTIPDGTPQKCAKPTVDYENGKFVFRCETKGVEFISQVLDDNVTAHSTGSIPLRPKYTIRVIARIKGSEDSDMTIAEFEWDNDNPKITYIK